MAAIIARCARRGDTCIDNHTCLHRMPAAQPDPIRLEDVCPVCLSCVLALALPASSAAQTVAIAQISGVVTDESGAALPGVEVVATQTSTGLTRFVITGTGGEYVLPNLPIGPYKLDAKLQGFNTFEQTGITLQVGLEPGHQHQPEGRHARGDGHRHRRRDDGRDAQHRGRHGGQPGADGGPAARRPAGVAARAALRRRRHAARRPDRQPAPVSFGRRDLGGRRHRQQHDLSGRRRVQQRSRSTTSASRCRFPDALEEFKVETGVRPARYGIYTGATVNAVTKAGTNSLHGNLFEFLRDHRFNAKNAFALVDDGLNRNQMGGTLGGPIKQNRMFFFGAFQYARNRQRPSDSQTFVPTAAMLNGDFTQIASAACNNGTALTLPPPFVDNRVNPALFNPIGDAHRRDCCRSRPIPAAASPTPCPTTTTSSRSSAASTGRRRAISASSAATTSPTTTAPPGYEGTNLLLSVGQRPRPRQPRADPVARRRLRAVAEPGERDALRVLRARASTAARATSSRTSPTSDRTSGRRRPSPACASSTSR